MTIGNRPDAAGEGLAWLPVIAFAIGGVVVVLGDSDDWNEVEVGFVVLAWLLFAGWAGARGNYEYSR